MDVWYLDDGTAVMLPELVDAYLRSYDDAASTQGGRRNRQKNKHGLARV